ncbi:hypothetical protein N9985_02995, partial [Gammaproteobacteria bacterium]|nr:hypothetical protein [Gammaproteobacteria bacterium]
NYVGRFINRFRFFGNPVTVGYASGRTVYKYSGDFLPSAAMLAAPVTKLLKTNTPRVFDNEVRIEYNVPEGSGSLRIDIWDQFGWVVRNLIREIGPVAGDRFSTWNGTDDVYRQVPSGVYIYRLTIDGVSESRVIRIRIPSP